MRIIPNLPIAKFKAGKASGVKMPAKRPAADALSTPKTGRSFPGFSTLLNPASKSTFVLFVGDEGAILIYIKGGSVQHRQFVPDNSADSLEELQATLKQDLHAPLLLVIDNMDQAYVQQTLPPVSPLSINKLIKRRLERDFGANDIKGAIVLGRDQAGRKDWNFLMVAVERTPQIAAWIDFVAGLPNRFQGIYLVPTETELILKTIENAMGVPKEGTGSEWKFFVSHNKVGGVRQVILRNGRLVFTRMTQLIGEATPAVIAGNIEQEILSTMEYMRRLSFDSQAGLDIYIIGSSELKPLIDQAKFNASSMHIMTPYEAAQYLGIEGATQPSDQFGDVILAAAIGCGRKHVLTLRPPQNRQLDACYQIMHFQRVAAAVIALGIIGYGGVILFNIYGTYAKMNDLEKMQAVREKSLESLRAEIEKSHLDVERADDLIYLYQKLQKNRITPLPFIAKISPIINRSIVVKNITWSLDNDKTGEDASKMTAIFILNFPGVETPEAFKAISKKITMDVKEALKGADVTFTKLPSKYLESQKLDISFGNKAPPSASQKETDNNQNDVELVIKGNVLTVSPPPSPVTPTLGRNPLLSTHSP